MVSNDPVGVGIEIGDESTDSASLGRILRRIDDSDECPRDCNLYLVSRYPVTSAGIEPELDMWIDTNETPP